MEKNSSLKKKVKINKEVNVILIPNKEDYDDVSELWYDNVSLDKIKMDAIMEVKRFAIIKNLSYKDALEEIYCII